jgi:quercetin dioxygenase-like cupin family protein
MMFGRVQLRVAVELAGMPEQAALDELDGMPHARPFGAGEPTVIRLALDAGEGVDPHTHPEREIVLSVRSGELEIDLDDETYEATAGDVLRFDGRREVSPYAVEDSEALIVLAQRTDPRG